MDICAGKHVSLGICVWGNTHPYDTGITTTTELDQLRQELAELKTMHVEKLTDTQQEAVTWAFTKSSPAETTDARCMLVPCQIW